MPKLDVLHIVQGVKNSSESCGRKHRLLTPRACWCPTCDPRFKPTAHVMVSRFGGPESGLCWAILCLQLGGHSPASCPGAAGSSSSPWLHSRGLSGRWSASLTRDSKEPTAEAPSPPRGRMGSCSQHLRVTPDSGFEGGGPHLSVGGCGWLLPPILH